MLFLGLLFCFPMAFHQPQPHHAELVVADLAVERKVDTALQVRRPGGFDVTAVADAREARRAVLNRDAVAGWLEEHATAVEAAIAVGVGRVLYVSLVSAAPTATYLNARDQWLTEQFLAGTGIRHTVLRAGFYAARPAALADEELVVSGPATTGRAASSPTRTSPR